MTTWIPQGGTARVGLYALAGALLAGYVEGGDGDSPVDTLYSAQDGLVTGVSKETAAAASWIPQGLAPGAWS